jgi:hypothetical protein
METDISTVDAEVPRLILKFEYVSFTICLFTVMLYTYLTATVESLVNMVMVSYIARETVIPALKNFHQKP